MIGVKIKEFRKGKSLSQQALAGILDTSSGYISEIEQGKAIPGGNFFCSLKREFPEIDLNWLIGDVTALVVNELGVSYAVDNDLREILQRILNEGDPAKIPVLRSMLVALDPGNK